MKEYRDILVTGGAGFVGSNLGLALREHFPQAKITALDNLQRKGSELNAPRLREGGVDFVRGDIRNPADLSFSGRSFDLLLECSAEPAVLAGYDSPRAVVEINLMGTFNCLEAARRWGADLLFFSTSRVYPIRALNALETVETESRFVLAPGQKVPGLSERGVAEGFSLEGPRSLYGATKLSSELLIQEFADMYGLRAVVNRCGVIAGPWQMGKVDQGVFALWAAMAHFRQKLKYIGWGGTGKQVRDLLNIQDLADLVLLELRGMDGFSGETFNVGGGLESSLSLLETTRLCEELTGRPMAVEPEPEGRPGDVKIYLTDNTKVTRATGWAPRRTPRETLSSIMEWIRKNEAVVKPLWVKG